MPNLKSVSKHGQQIELSIMIAKVTPVELIMAARIVVSHCNK